MHYRLALVVAVLGSMAYGDWVQWDSGSGGNDHWYQAVYVPGGLTQAAAGTEAEGAGGYLATILSAAENTFAQSLVSDPKFWYQDTYTNGIGPWLGGYQYDKLAEPGGHWAWVTGETWGFTNWAGGEPNNSGNAEDALHFFASGTLVGSVWNDVSPGLDTVKGYVMESDTYPVPEPSSLCLIGGGLALALCRRRRLSA